MKDKDSSQNEISVSTRPPATTAQLAQVAITVTEFVRTQEYPPALANKDRLDFILQQCKVQVASPVSYMKLIAERASITPQVFQEVHERYNAHSHWGLNE